MKSLILHFIFFTTTLALTLLAFYIFGKKIWYPYYERCFTQQQIKAIECNLTHINPHLQLNKERNCTQIPNFPFTKEQTIPETPPLKQSADKRLNHILAESNFIVYPKKLTLIGLKHEQLLEIWGELKGKYIHIYTYPFTAFSGTLGPKLKEGDLQIPEGIYSISYLNPNSKFHLSMRISYPNAFDRKMAKSEKRKNLGGDIMIHGGNRTVGCIPLGDDNIEELYRLVEKVGIQNTKIILSPIDFRQTTVNIKTKKHPWLKELYAKIKKEMKPFTSK